MNKKSVDRYVEQTPRSTVNAPRSDTISSCLKQLFTNMIPLMSINFLLLFDNLNSATPCKTKTRHNAWTAHKRREIMQGTRYSIALFISDDSVFYLFYLFVSLTRTIRNGRQFPRPPASLFHADGGKYTEIVHVMQQIKGDKI